MTITATTLRAQYNGNGATTAFAVPFEFLDAEGVKVIFTDTDGDDVTWVKDTHYTLTSNTAAATGTVNVKTTPTDYTPASGTKITILRNQALKQLASYTENDPFPAKTHEKALDRLDMQIQMHAEKLERAVLYKDTSTNSGAILPEPEASKVLGWNAAGTALENKGITELGNYANVGEALADATAKTTPVDADTLPLTDSADSNALKKVTWANIKATLQNTLQATASVFGLTRYASASEARARASTTRATTPAILVEVGEPIFLFAWGQSNVDPQLSLSWTPEANLYRWNNTAVGTGGAVGTAFVAMPNSTIGPAVVWANEIAKRFPLNKVHLIVGADAGQPIAKWMAAGPPSPNMYAYGEAAVEAALTAGGGTRLHGVFVWEGETDAAAASTTFYSDVNTVLDRFDGETWHPVDTPITLMGLSERDGTTLAAFNQNLARIAADEPERRKFVRTYNVGSWAVDNLHMAAAADYVLAGRYAALQMGTGVLQNTYTNPFTGDLISRRDFDGTHSFTIRNSNSGTSAIAASVVQNNSGTSTLEALAGAFAGFLRWTWTGAGQIIFVSAPGFIFQKSGVNVLTLTTALLSKQPIGYGEAAAGVGGAQTQGTSKSTAVTLDKAVGQITTHNATLNAATIVSFTLNNSLIATNDLLILNHDSGGTAGAYTLNAACGAGSAVITLRNNTAGNLGEALVISFALIKGVVD